MVGCVALGGDDVLRGGRVHLLERAGGRRRERRGRRGVRRLRAITNTLHLAGSPRSTAVHSPIYMVTPARALKPCA